MPIFELFASAMLAISASLKIRALRRAGLGVPPGPAVEVVAALVIASMALFRATGSGGLPRWGIPAAFLLLVVSSVDHYRRLARVRGLRVKTEAGRLQAHVRHLSGSSGEGS